MVSPFGSKSSNNMHPSEFQKTVPIILPAEGIVLAFFFWTCRVMPLHAMSFRLWIEMIEPASITRLSHRPRHDVLEATLMTSHSLLSCPPVSKRGTQQEQPFRYPKVAVISCTTRCPVPHCVAISLSVTLRSSPVSASQEDRLLSVTTIKNT